MRRLCLWLGLALALLVPNALIANQERLLANSTAFYMELAPVDPRSLMQGDYMRLDYRLLREPVPGPEVRVDLDSRGVAISLAGSGPRLRLQQENGRWILPGCENFFFEEGQGGHFQAARFAQLRTSPDGRAWLVDLYDQELKKL